MTGTVDPVDHWATEIRTSFCEQIDPVGPPLDELICDLDLPHPTEYELFLIMSQDS
jgi:hypothetical protein